STMQTAAMPTFRSAVQKGEHIFLVADEVHRVGSPENRNILSLNSGPRLGLSATPRRAGDPEGTAAILDYFGGLLPPPFTDQEPSPHTSTTCTGSPSPTMSRKSGMSLRPPWGRSTRVSTAPSVAARISLHGSRTCLYEGLA